MVADTGREREMALSVNQNIKHGLAVKWGHFNKNSWNMEFNGGGPHPKNTTVRSIGWNPECCSFFAPFISFWAPLAMDCSPETEKRSSFYLGDRYDLGIPTVVFFFLFFDMTKPAARRSSLVGERAMTASLLRAVQQR